MTYSELAIALNTENSAFSVSTKGIDWEADWEGDSFAVANFPELIAVEGKIVLKHDGWGDKGVFSREYENPTWMEVVAFFEEAIVAVEDSHHIFLEAINDDGTIVAGS